MPEAGCAKLCVLKQVCSFSEPTRMSCDLLRKVFCCVPKRLQVVAHLRSAVIIVAGLHGNLPPVAIIGSDLQDSNLTDLRAWSVIGGKYPDTRTVLIRGSPGRKFAVYPCKHSVDGVFRRDRAFGHACKAVSRAELVLCCQRHSEDDGEELAAKTEVTARDASATRRRGCG
jgi:hypothetical protein